jgi:chloramphenicol-sensitive protein RarD
VSRHRLGLLLGAAAYVMWGLFPLYWPLVQPAAATEILAHRVVWSLLVVLLLLAAWRRLARLGHIPRRAWGYLAFAAVLISVNWGTYIYGVNSDQVVETSLGYFIGPLVTVGMAVVLLGERLRPAQWAALALAGLAVVVLTVDYGRPPWIALTLAFSFATYGLLKKKADVGAAESLAVETSVLVAPALGYLLWLEAAGTGTFGHVSTTHSLLLAGAGLVTVLPLLAFSAAATRIPLSTLGLLQYIGPTLQFGIGVFVYDEPMPPARLAGFVLVWTSLALFTAEAFAYRRRQLVLAATPTG